MQNYTSNIQATKFIEYYLTQVNKSGGFKHNLMLVGPPGVGKTTYANHLGALVESEVKYINCAGIKSPTEIINILSNVETNNIIFFDEIHLLKRSFYELFYNVMEDGFLNVIYTFEETTKSIKLPVDNFVLVCATTNVYSLPSPFIDRFNTTITFNYYTEHEMYNFINGLNDKLSDDLISEIIDASGGVPRTARNLVDKVNSCQKNIDSLYETFGINYLGLSQFMVKYICYLKDKPSVSLSKMSSILGSEQNNVKNNIEPTLLRLDLIEISTSGRYLTAKGHEYEAAKYKTRKTLSWTYQLH